MKSENIKVGRRVKYTGAISLGKGKFFIGEICGKYGSTIMELIEIGCNNGYPGRIWHHEQIDNHKVLWGQEKE